MIRYGRDGVARPAALDKAYGSRSKAPKIPGKTERHAVVKAFEKHVAAGKDPVEFSFPFDRYRSSDVKVALRQVFRGKCAYCESNYAGTQPMDVEHWRPKGEVHEAGNKLPGYYWLAAHWENLYPSCIDCNRSRTQIDALTKEELALGKANQFPVKGPRIVDPDDDLAGELPLIVDPCAEDPEELFSYTEEGFILPAAPGGDAHDRALESIRVYALNRADLVAERLAVRTLVDHRIQLIGRLGEIRGEVDPTASAAVFEALSDLIAAETEDLLTMADDDQPYAGMVREMLRDADPTG